MTPLPAIWSDLETVSITTLKKMAFEILSTESVVRKLMLSEPDEVRRGELLVTIERYSKLSHNELSH